MKNNQQKKMFLKHLRTIPIIQVACEKSGIARATIYRWKNKSKKFTKDMEEVLIEGEALINDMGESQLVTLIREKNFSAIRFWLNHRHSKFCERIEVTNKFKKQEKLTMDQEKLVQEALRLASSEFKIVNSKKDEKDKS